MQIKQPGADARLKPLGNYNILIEAIVANESSDALQTALKQAEARKTALAAELAMAKVPAPRLLPNLAELYRAKVAALQEALAWEDAAAARERVRCLIEEVRVVPSPADPKAVPAIEVRGALAAMLALGSGEDASAAVQLEKQFKLVAGARNQLELLTRG